MNTAADLLQKLRHERADFIQSNCIDQRHALNAVMTAYHLCEWVFPELSGRPNFPHSNLSYFREALKDMADSPIADAGRITNGTKHFKQDRIRTGEHKGVFQRNMVQPDVFDVSYLWLEREGGRRQQSKSSSMSWSSFGITTLRTMDCLNTLRRSVQKVANIVHVARS